MSLTSDDIKNIKHAVREVLDERDKKAKQGADSIARRATVFSSYVGVGGTVFAAALALGLSSGLFVRGVAIATMVLSCGYLGLGFHRLNQLKAAEKG